MISHRSKSFDRHLSRLPKRVQKLAHKNFLLWKANPGHPSLDFKEIKPGRWSARVGDHYRVLGSKQPDGAIVWAWIGTHETYDKLLRQR